VRTKLSLSNKEQQEYNVTAKRLTAVGLLSPEEKPLPEARILSLEQTGNPVDSFVHATPAPGYGIVVWVRIVALKSGVNLSGCQVMPRRWEDNGLRLVDATEGVYSYAAIGGVEYPATTMLNPWISSNRSLRCGKVLEGLVMVRSPRSLPAWCVEGISIEVDLRFFDQFDNVYPLKVELRVMRDAERRVERPRRTGLFGPAVDASGHGTYRDEPQPGHEGILPKEPMCPRPNGPQHK
jgi:hypothetical protein